MFLHAFAFITGLFVFFGEYQKLICIKNCGFYSRFFYPEKSSKGKGTQKLPHFHILSIHFPLFLSLIFSTFFFFIFCSVSTFDYFIFSFMNCGSELEFARLYLMFFLFFFKYLNILISRKRFIAVFEWFIGSLLLSLKAFLLYGLLFAQVLVKFLR